MCGAEEENVKLDTDREGLQETFQSRFQRLNLTTHTPAAVCDEINRWSIRRKGEFRDQIHHECLLIANGWMSL